MENDEAVRQMSIDFRKVMIQSRLRFYVVLSMGLVNPRKYPANKMYGYLNESHGNGRIIKYVSDIRSFTVHNGPKEVEDLFPSITVQLAPRRCYQ
jgi:hypothetical protein